MSNIRKESEKQFFDNAFEIDARSHLDKYYSIVKSSRICYENYIKENSRDKIILEYGCGRGEYAFKIKDFCQKVIGIDISEVGIRIANEKAQKLGITNTEFYEMDAENLTFKDNTFDLICGNCILHHLNLENAMNEIIRVLKPNGKAVFIEPLGLNPAINLYRKLTPKLRTEDEHPLKLNELKFIQSYFKISNNKYFHLFSLLAIPFRKFKNFKNILNYLDNFDRFAIKYFHFIAPLSWMVVIILENPKK